MRTGFFCVTIAVVLLAGFTPAFAAVTVLGSGTGKDEADNDQEFTFNVTVPTGTQLAVIGVTNHDDRGVERVKFDNNTSLFTPIVDSEASGMDERAALLYFKNPPAGAQVVNVKITGNSLHKAAGILFLGGVDMDAFSAPGAATPLVPTAKYAGGGAGASTLSFTAAEAPEGRLAISAVMNKGKTLTVSGSQTQQWWQETNDDDWWVIIKTYGRHAGGTVPGSASGATLSWQNGDNWGMVATVIPTANQGPIGIGTAGLTVGDAAPNGTVAGTLTVTDPDGAAPYAWTLVDNAGGRFALSGGTAASVNVVVADTSLLDRGVAASHTIRVRVDDAATYNTAFEGDLTVQVTDTTAPTAGTITATPALVRDGAITSVTAVITDNVGVSGLPSIVVNGIDTGTPLVSGNAYTSLWQVPAGSAEGPATITVSAVDAAGNPGSGGSTSALVIDNTPPVLSGFAVSDDCVKPGDTLTVSATATDLHGIAPSPVLLVNGLDAGVPAVDGDRYTWTYPVPQDTPEGLLVLSVTARDPAGNERQGVAADMVTVDATPPVIFDIQSSVFWARGGTSVTVSATVSDNRGLSGLPVLHVNGNVLTAPEVTGNQYSWTFTVSSSEPAGPAAITVEAADQAGNTASASPPATILTVDQSAPAIQTPAVSPLRATTGTAVTVRAYVLDNYGLASPPSLTVNGISAGTPSESAHVWTWVFTVPAGQPEGTAALLVTAVDYAGNSRSLGSSALVIDPNGPIVSGVSASPNAARASMAVTVKATITDLSGISGTPALTINGVSALYTGIAAGEHCWTQTIPGTGPEGQATLVFSVSDTLGNTRSTTVSDVLFLDRIAPQITEIQASPNLAKGGDVVRILFRATDAGTGVDGTPTVVVNGMTAAFQSRTDDRYEYRITLRPAEPEGTASINISARDMVGNAGSGASSALVVDNSVPTVGDVSVYPQHARDNTEVRIGFRVNDTNGLQGAPQVTVNGRPAAYSADESGRYEYLYTVHRGIDAEGPATVQISATDTTGHTGTSQSAGLLLIDTTPPGGSLVLNSGKLFTRVAAVTARLYPDDGPLGSGVTEMSISDNGDFWQPWEAFAAVRLVEIAPGQGWRTVYARFRDRAGNESAAPVSDTIALKPNPLAVDRESPEHVEAGTGTATVLEVGVRNVFGHVVSYDWRKDGVSLPLEAGVIAGPALALDHLEFEDAGSYTCMVADELESKESEPFVLEVENHVPAAGAVSMAALAALVAGAAVLLLRRGARRGTALLCAVLFGMLAAVSARAEVAVVYSAKTESSAIGNDALRALAMEKGSVEIWTRGEDGKVKRELSRVGEPGVANPGFTSLQREEMDKRAASGARKTLQKDGSALVTAELGPNASLVFTQPKSLDGPTFDARLVVDGEVIWTEQRWEETVNGTLRPLFIRVDFAKGAMAQVFQYTDSPPAALPPLFLRNESAGKVPEGMQPYALPMEKADTVDRDVQFIVPSQGLDTLGFDSGWVPGGSGPDPGGFIIQVRINASAGYNYDAAVNGRFSLVDGNVLGLGPASGNWGFYFGAQFFFKAAFDIPPILGWDLDPFTVDIPYVPDFNMVASDRDTFGNWLLDSTSTVRDEAGRTNVVNLNLVSLLITQGVLPELPSWVPLPAVGAKLDVAAIANGTMTCDSISLSDGNVYTTEGQANPITVPPTGYSALAAYNDVSSLNLGAKIYPGVYFSWLGFRWDWPVEGDDNILTRLEWLPIHHTNFPFTTAELNFTGTPSTGDPQDWFTQYFNVGDTNDLGMKRIRFTPNLSNNFYIACLEDPVSAYRTPITGAVQLPLANDQFVKVDLADGKQVPLYGRQYGSLYVGSNGYITFEGGDTSHDVSLEHHFDQPRISALLTELKLAQGGKVYFQQLPNRAVVTWDHAFINNIITQQTASVQVEMFFDGRIVITWLQLDLYGGLAGLSRGGGVPAEFSESDLSRYGGCLGGIAEESGVRVNFTPPEVLPFNPRWRLDGGEWQPSGAMVSATIGSHTLSFNYIPNLWAAPAPMQISASLPDVTMTHTVQWTRQKGTVIINAQPAGAPWSFVDGDGAVHTGTGSAEVADVPTGTCTLTWQDLPTWAKPSPDTQALFLYPNASVVFFGVYAPVIGEGRADVTVNIEPAEVVPAGARWRANDGAWQDSGVTVSIPDGDGTVSFLDVAGWTKPAPITQFFTRDTATTFTGTYARQKGGVIVDVEPNGASWTLLDGDGLPHEGTGDAMLSDLPTGESSIIWHPVASYMLPDPTPQTFSIEAGTVKRVVGAYRPIIGEGEGILRVTLLPEGAVSAGAKWRLLAGDWNSSGAMLAVADGERTVKFMDLEGWITPPDRTVNVVRDVTNDVSATYTRLTGTVVVNVTPDNASWTVTDADGGVRNGAGDAVLENVPTGPLTVLWGGLKGYAAPEPNPASHTVAAGGTVTLSGVYVKAVLTADFTASPRHGAAPFDVVFTDLSTSTTKPIQQWTWYFGDGKTSTERSPRHVYRDAGVYAVTLSVSTADQMAMETKKEFITVEQGVPVAGLGAVAGLAALLAAAGGRVLRRRG